MEAEPHVLLTGFTESLPISRINFDNLTPVQSGEMTEYFTTNPTHMEYVATDQRGRMGELKLSKFGGEASATLNKERGKRKVHKVKEEGHAQYRTQRDCKRTLNGITRLQANPGHLMVEVSHSGKVKEIRCFGELDDFLDRKLGNGRQAEMLETGLAIAFPAGKHRKGPLPFVVKLLQKAEEDGLLTYEEGRYGPSCLIYSPTRDVLKSEFKY